MASRERRSQPRDLHEKLVTATIQSILKDPVHTANDLESDLRAGGDQKAALALLVAAESLASLRGLDIGPQVASIRMQLKKAGFLR